MKKKVLAALLAGCMVMSLAACGGGSDDTASDSSAETTDDASADDAGDAAAIETVAEGKLTVATSPDYAPYEFYAIDEEGNPTLAGFDLALAQYIADYMGLELEIITVDFDGVLSELQTKSVDLGMAGLAPDEKRENIMDFSDIYYDGEQSVVTTKENADKFTSFDALNDPDVQVGAQIASLQFDLANENTPDADIISLPKVTDIVSELVAGTLDAAFMETAIAESYQKNYPDLQIVLDVETDVTGSAIGDQPLLDAVNEAIAAAVEDGSMDQFVAEANELAAGQTYEGLLDDAGNIQ